MITLLNPKSDKSLSISQHRDRREFCTCKTQISLQKCNFLNQQEQRGKENFRKWRENWREMGEARVTEVITSACDVGFIEKDRWYVRRTPCASHNKVVYVYITSLSGRWRILLHVNKALLSLSARATLVFFTYTMDSQFTC